MVFYMDALILAGGENKRLPVIKSFIKIHDRKLIDTNIELLKTLFKRVLISTNSPELFFYLETPMVGDIIEYKGPMTGIFTALSLPDVSEIFVTACDMPFINGILIQYIVGHWDNRFDAAVPLFNKKPQPLFGIYSKKIANDMEQSIKNEKRSLRDFLKKVDVLYIPEEEVRRIDPEGRSFVNINTMEDLNRETGEVKC